MILESFCIWSNRLPLVRSKDDILLLCISYKTEKCTPVYRSVYSFYLKMEVVLTCESLTNFCPNAFVCRDVPEKYFIHAYIHTYTYTQPSTHTHTHTHTHEHIPTYPPTYPLLRIYTDTNNIQNLQGVTRAACLQQAKCFKYHTRKCCCVPTKGKKTRIREDVGPLFWQTCSRTHCFGPSQKLEFYVFFWIQWK
jgi:hypothetical protein